MWCWSAALLVIMMGTAPSAVTLAKPPDLPADNDIRCPETRDGENGLDPESSASAQKARALFEAAGRLTRAGDLNQARARLREAHMENPTSHYGQRAIQRLLEMEAYDPGEESEPPVPAKRLFKPLLQRILDALETTQPLGMIRGQTY
jgi:hypothetical protein